MESLDTLLDLLTRAEFLVGLILGTFAFGFFLLVKKGPNGLPLWGTAAAGATLAGVFLTIGQRLGLLAGVLLACAGGYLVQGDWFRSQTRSPKGGFGWLLVVLGAVVVVSRDDNASASWLSVVGPLVLVGIGIALREWTSFKRRDLLGVLFTITAFGIWTTVPETESARVLLGVSAPMALATVRGVDARIAPPGAFALASVVVWIAASGGSERHGSIVGAIGSLGLLVLLPLLPQAWDRLSTWIILGLHGFVVLISARVFGLMENALPAGVGVLTTMAIVYVLLMWLARENLTEEQPGSLS